LLPGERHELRANPDGELVAAERAIGDAEHDMHGLWLGCVDLEAPRQDRRGLQFNMLSRPRFE
jgi:hypothetical protein